jgi:hypothetical protein
MLARACRLTLVALLHSLCSDAAQGPSEAGEDNQAARMPNYMTAGEAIEAAKNATPGERWLGYEAHCAERGCRREPLANDSGRWTWCPDCLTVFDDYGKAVNPVENARPLAREGRPS